MSVSKAWDWSAETGPIWLHPSEESYYIADRWKQAGYRSLLDFGCGLGRHSIFFARAGFRVSAFDLSQEGVAHLKQWAAKETLDIDARPADMLSPPYPDHAFDCLFAYHVISHTDTPGMRTVMRELKRLVRPGGELFITLCSKETWSFAEAGYPKVDENTVRKTEDGSEKDVLHFYVNLEDIIGLFDEFHLELLRVRHTDDCYFEGEKRNSRHYFILAGNPGEHDITEAR